MFQPFGFMSTQAGGGGDVDANAYIAAVTTSGGTLSAGDETAIQTLYTDLKAGSLYTKLKLMYPIMGGTPSSHGVEGIDPSDVNKPLTYQGVLTGTANHTAAGMSVFATEFGIAKNNISPATLLTTANDSSIGYYLTSAVATGGGFFVGNTQNSSGANTRWQIYFATNDVYLVIGTTNFALYNNGALPNGRWIGTRRTDSDLELYKNGSSVATNTGTSTNNLSIYPMSIFGADGSPNSNQTRGTCGFLFFGLSLTDAEASSLDVIIDDFLTTIGR